MKLFETHTHTSGSSLCSQIPPGDMPGLLKNAGIDSFMLTNHFSKWQSEVMNYTNKTWIQRYIDEYKLVKAAADTAGIPAILGAEVAIIVDGRSTDFVLFGTSEEFLRESPILYNLSQRELYRVCVDADVPMYQAHPFRTEHGHSPADPEFMDGVEINLHSFFLRKEELVYEFADKYDLGVTCGSDVHYVNQAGTGGILSGEIIDTPKKAIEFMKTHKRPQIYVR